MFQYNCVVEFSPDCIPALDLLQKMGYRSVYPKVLMDNYLVTETDCDGYPVFYFTEVPPIGDYIDCEQNIQFFLEAAAISDSTDAFQVFILDEGFVQSDGAFCLSGNRFFCTKDKLPEVYNAHKATLEEIYNYYK